LADQALSESAMPDEGQNEAPCSTARELCLLNIISQNGAWQFN
jgi:hypothetical protein